MSKVILHPSAKDERGYFQVVVRFDESPNFLKNESWIRRYEGIKIERCFIYKVTSFIGWDRGDIGEAGIAIFDAAGRAIYERSDHKEAGIFLFKEGRDLQRVGIAHFNAIETRRTDALTDQISIHIDAWPTGINPDKHTIEKQARPDIHFRLWCKGVRV